MSAGDWKDFYGACIRGDLSIVRYHIDRKIDPNYQHPEFEVTALVTAILNGHTDIALFLLDHGADPSLHSQFDLMTPEQAALRMGNSQVLAALKARGALTWRSWLRPLWRAKT